MTSYANDINNSFPPLSSIQRLAISESGFVFDPVSGHNFTVNETGLAILRLLQKNTEVKPVLAHLVKEYDVSPRDAERDVMEFAGVLRSFVGD
jgi:hypothetical protein